MSWNGLLDAMDLLQNAIDGLDKTRTDGVDQGLTLVLVRLDRFLSQNGITRVGARGGTALFGHTASTAGDVDGDGWDDLWVCDLDTAWLFTGGLYP